jgi:hypothetical protein
MFAWQCMYFGRLMSGNAWGGGVGVSPLPWVKEHRTGVKDRYVCCSYLKGGCGVLTHYIIVVYTLMYIQTQNNPNQTSTFHTPSSADTYTKSYCSKNVKAFPPEAGVSVPESSRLRA